MISIAQGVRNVGWKTVLDCEINENVSAGVEAGWPQQYTGAGEPSRLDTDHINQQYTPQLLIQCRYWYSNTVIKLASTSEYSRARAGSQPGQNLNNECLTGCNTFHYAAITTRSDHILYIPAIARAQVVQIHSLSSQRTRIRGISSIGFCHRST